METIDIGQRHAVINTGANGLLELVSYVDDDAKSLPADYPTWRVYRQNQGTLHWDAYPGAIPYITNDEPTGQP